MDCGSTLIPAEHSALVILKGVFVSSSMAIGVGVRQARALVVDIDPHLRCGLV